MGSGWGSEKCRTRPADVLIPNWSLGKPVTLDLTVTYPLYAEIISEASVTAGSAAYAAKQRKYIANDPKCNELGWICVPLAVELYGYWGSEARQTLSRLGSCLACQLRCSISQAITRLYGNLSIALVQVQANARALLARVQAVRMVLAMIWFSHLCIYIYIYMGQCPAKSPLWYFFKISRTSKRKLTLALKCMANYKFSA